MKWNVGHCKLWSGWMINNLTAPHCAQANQSKFMIQIRFNLFAFARQQQQFFGGDRLINDSSYRESWKLFECSKRRMRKTEFNQTKGEMKFLFHFALLIEFGQHFESCKALAKISNPYSGKENNERKLRKLLVNHTIPRREQSDECMHSHKLAPSVTQRQLRARSPVNLVHSRHVLIVAKWCAVRGDLTRGHSLLRLVNCRAPYKTN